MRGLIIFLIICIWISGCTRHNTPEMMTAENAQAIILLAKSKLNNGESFLMVEGFDDALKYYESIQDSSALPDVYKLAAVKMQWLNRQDSAAGYLAKAKDIASSTTHPTRSEILIELSNLYAKPSLRKDYPRALSYAFEAYKAALTNEEKSRALHDIGLFYSFIGRNDSSAIYMERALADADTADPMFTTYALNYANNPSADFKRSVIYLNQIKRPSLGKLITLGFIYLNNSQIDSARYYSETSNSMYKENPARYSINTYNNLRLLEQSIGLLETRTVVPYEGTVSNDSISEITAIQRKISEERRDFNNRLKLQLLESKAHRQLLLNISLGILLISALGFVGYVWYTKRKILIFKQRLDNLKVDQILADANDDESTEPLDLVRRRIDVCIEQFREAKLQTDLDKITIQYRNTGNYPSVKERERISKNLIGCFADLIVDLKMTGVKLNMEDIMTCILSCLKESNATIAVCLGSTDTAVRTRKSRLRAKLPVEMVNLLGL